MPGVVCFRSSSPILGRAMAILILAVLWAAPIDAAGDQPQDLAEGKMCRGLILAMNRPLDSEADRLFRGVINSSVRWSLERQELGIIEKNAPIFDSTAVRDPLQILDISEKQSVDYILITEYGSRGTDLEIRLAWYDPQTGEKTVEVIRRGRKDLVLDKLIRQALSELLSAVADSLADLPMREILPENASAAATTAGLIGKPGPESSGHGDSEQTPITGGSPPAAVPSLPDAEINQPHELTIAERQRHFEIGVGCAPFIATGAASEYFKLGILPSLNLNYLFQGERNRFALGLYAGMNIFRASGAAASAETYLVPLGLNLRYELGVERFPCVMFGASAGPALFAMNTSSTGMLFGLTFYVRGTLGVRLPIGRTFALIIEAGYDFYWEQPHPIMGFSPALSTTFRM